VIPTRESGASHPNVDLHELRPKRGEGNVAWFARCGLQDGVVLLGGSSLVDFRLRVAQSQLRGDLTPSYWSLCGLISHSDRRFLTVPLQIPDISDVPRTNAVQELRLSDVDDPVAWPNIGIVRFAGNAAAVVAQADKLHIRRSVVDLPELVLAWLAYGWAAGGADNPLLRTRGVPSAAFVETAHALAGIELTPGLSSASSCPEAIWQAVKWWREYYEGAVEVAGRGEARPVVPVGVYGLRQRAAMMVIRPDSATAAAAAVRAAPRGGATA
jgi:hypothetical protein